MKDYLSKLNSEQIKPVTDTEGAVLVLAGAGSGKTRVLTSRIAYLVDEKGVSPRNILAITFTNKAAEEMKVRLDAIIGNTDELWCSTIHSMCVRILRRNADRLGYTQNFSIYDEVDKENLIKRIIKRLNVTKDDDSNLKKYAKDASYFISDAKNKGITPLSAALEIPKTETSERNINVYMEYEAEMKHSNAFDFDDLLLKTYELLRGCDDVREYYAEKFRYVHIDEFQDINPIQYTIARFLSSHHQNIFAVGDDDQSIYGWRGAEVKTILNFGKDFKGAKVYKLEQNYRSTKKILDLANTVIVDNKERTNKVLWTENQAGADAVGYEAENGNGEAFYTARTIKSLLVQGYEYSDIAVLMRVNALSRAYEQSFLEYGIPYRVYGGFKFFERKEIKDLIAYLKVINNPFDNEALLRIINVPKRGIGDKSIETLLAYANENGVSVFDAMGDVEELSLTKSAKERITEFRKLLRQLMISTELCDLVDFYDTVLDKTNYLSVFAEDTDENDSKKMNVQELRNSVVEFKKMNPQAVLSDYLNSVTLSSDTDEMSDGNVVTVATIHSVKGLEFKAVFICGVEANLFPSQRAIDEGRLEEERRLMYVAITRAREKLYVTRAKERRLYGKESTPTARSSFLEKIATKLGLPAKAESFKASQNREWGQSSYGYGRYNQRESSYSDSSSYSSYSNSSNVSSFKNSLLNGSQKPSTQPAKDYSSFAPGVKVRHQRFGEGTVLGVKPNGENTIVKVAFPGVGIKDLAVKYAPMTIIKS